MSATDPVLAQILAYARKRWCWDDESAIIEHYQRCYDPACDTPEAFVDALADDYDFIDPRTVLYPAPYTRGAAMDEHPLQDKPKPLRTPPPEVEARLKSQLAVSRAMLAALEARKPELEEKGSEALQRLLPVAKRDTGQSRVIARFLLGLYNGNRFPFDLTDLRCIDLELFEDCMAVLQMDALVQRREVHTYFGSEGGALFEQIAEDWNMRDFQGENWRSKEQP